MNERHIFMVVNRGPDYLLEELAAPQAGHSLSFVGTTLEGRPRHKKAALEHLSRIGLRGIEQSHISAAKDNRVSYHGKVGVFFNLLLPIGTELELLQETAQGRFVIRSYAQLMAALKEGKLMELSKRYTEKRLVVNEER